MKFLVTGGAGFIGSHTCEALIQRGSHVVAFDNLSSGRLQNLESVWESSLFEFVEGDIRSIKNLEAVFDEITHVIHFAGIGEIVPSIDNPLEYLDVNVIGTANLLEVSRKYSIQSFVYAASSSCYGLALTPTNENAPIDLRHPYAVSKYLGETLCLNWKEIYGLPVKSIRIFNAYGRRVRTTGSYGAVLGVFLKQKLENKALTVVGDGEQLRDYVHVSDVANAFIEASHSPKIGRVWNLGSGLGISINRLAEMIGGDIVYIPDRPGEPRITLADISLIKEDLDWSPKISFEDGLLEILKFIDEWKDAPLWTPSSIENATKNWFAVLNKDNLGS